MSELFDRLDELAAAQDFEGVEVAATDAIVAGGDDADLWRYVAWARFEQGLFKQAHEAALEAGDDLYAARSLFHLWEFDDAQAALDRFTNDDPEENAEAEWYRGLLAEFAGGDATVHFRRAAELAPDLFAAPVRLSDEEVDAVLKEAVAALPKDVRESVDQTVIELRDLPQEHPDVDPLSLGLYWGVNRLEESVDASGQLPSRIEIYRRNVERIASDRAEAIDELRITLLHEIGHHLGFDEQDVFDLGLG